VAAVAEAVVSVPVATFARYGVVRRSLHDDH
jgi:hypothetical protein